mmetsp:Transcript_41001/g.101183  ORF Transcript_41001/g.101183 Transcript_41001/m.101183 type:complete len:162 (-) Transcript_41001:433-918(-)
MEIFVQDLYHFAREIITAHDCKTFDTGAQILTSVQCLKQVYMPIMQMGPSQFDQLMQLNATHSTPALSFLLAQFHQQTNSQRPPSASASRTISASTTRRRTSSRATGHVRHLCPAAPRSRCRRSPPPTTTGLLRKSLSSRSYLRQARTRTSHDPPRPFCNY